MQKLYHQYLETPTRTQLQQIYDLRVTAWSPNPSFDASLYPNGLFDKLDPKSHHWVIEDNGIIVAAARVAIVEHLTDIPDWQVFGQSSLPSLSPIAYLSRLVVHPSYQGCGFSRLFDQMRLNFVDAHRIPITICWTSNYRVNAINRQGFVIAGLSDERFNFYKSRSYVQYRLHPNFENNLNQPLPGIPPVAAACTV